MKENPLRFAQLRTSYVLTQSGNRVPQGRPVEQPRVAQRDVCLIASKFSERIGLCPSDLELVHVVATSN